MSKHNFDSMDTLSLIDYIHDLTIDILHVEMEIVGLEEEGLDKEAKQCKDELYQMVQTLNAAEMDLKLRGGY
jgi:hypothetical protein